MKFRALLLAAGLVVLPIGAFGADAVPDRAALFGDYLSGSYARYLSDADAQSRFYQSAYKAAPDDVRLGRLALYSALFSDDISLTKRTAQSLYKQDKTESMARTVLAVDAMSRGRSAAVRKYTQTPTSDVTMGLAMRLMRGWNAVDEGRYEDAREVFQSLGGSPYFKHLGELQIAKLEARAGNAEAAKAAFDSVGESGIAPIEYRLARARFEAANGEADAAKARLTEFIEDNPAAVLGPIGAYLNRLEAGSKLPKLSIKAETARALTEPSYAFFVRSNSKEGAETFLRFARWIDPDYDKAAIWLATLLEDEPGAVTTDVEEEILALYGSVGSNSPYIESAQLGIANVWFDREDDARALKILEDLAALKPSYYTREALGRARFFRENWAEALPFYNDLVESLSDEELTRNPEPLRLRGIIFERLDRWPEAEADFKRVLDINPEDADTLNYLGYTWVDRGENLTEAFDMIEKAVELEPDSGAITDSLGWAHYKLGRYAEAKTNLEKAVVLTPYSATIIDHLGDVYWRLDRKREAVYQWQRALEYDPEEDEKANIEAKLAAGLNAQPAD